jgi:hypothetical protein
MPTASKLVAAICFAIFGFMAAEVVKPSLPEGTQVGLFSPIMAAIGLLCGWLVMGRLTKRGYRDAMGSGVRTAITVVVWGIIVFSIYRMVVLSTQSRYDGPMEAVTASIGIMLEYGRLLLDPKILGTFLIGGLLSGAISEWAGKRWD